MKNLWYFSTRYLLFSPKKLDLAYLPIHFFWKTFKYTVKYKHCKYYVVKKLHNNLKIELMKWQAHKVRGCLFDNNKNSLAEQKELGELIREWRIKEWCVLHNFELQDIIWNHFTQFHWCATKLLNANKNCSDAMPSTTSRSVPLTVMLF